MVVVVSIVVGRIDVVVSVAVSVVVVVVVGRANELD